VTLLKCSNVFFAFVLSLQDGEFHSYVRPTVNPILSAFCTTLTGIQQVQSLGFLFCFHIQIKNIFPGNG